MAEEEEKEESKGGDGGGKKSPMMLIIIIVVLILLIIIGAVVAVLLMSGGEEEQVQQQQQVEQSQQNTPSKKKTYARKEAAKSFIEMGPIFPLETFTVNLLSESGRRYLKVEMSLELSGEEVAVELDTTQPAVRDIIIKLLSSKSLEEISTAKGKEKLKDQIIEALNARLKDGSIENIFFTKFVVQ